MLPYDTFQLIFNKWIRICSSFVGCNVLDTKYHFLSLGPIVVCLYTGIAFVSSSYTILTFNVDLGLQCIVLNSILGQVSFKAHRTKRASCNILNVSFRSLTQLVMKCVSLVLNRRLIVAQRYALDEIYKSNNFNDCPIMTSCSENSMRLFKALLLLYCFSGLGFLVWTIGEYLILGSDLPSFSQLPGINSSKTPGFLIMALFHVILTTMSSLGMGAVDGTVAVFTFNIRAFSGLFKQQIERLNAKLEQRDVNNSSQFIRYKFRNIIMMHREMTQYAFESVYCV